MDSVFFVLHQVREFDLTRPGTHFKSAYYDNGDEKSEREPFKEDHESLESILTEKGISQEQTRAHRNTIAATTGTGKFLAPSNLPVHNPSPPHTYPTTCLLFM